MLLKWFYGVTVAQEILVLLEIVRFSLELHIYWIKSIFFIFVLLLVKVVVLYLEATLFECFLYLNNLFFFSTACDKSLSYMPLKQLGNALHTQI